MFQDNPLLAQLKQEISSTLERVEGTVKATDKNYGFLEIDSKNSIFIPPPAMKRCLHGDKVVAVIREDKGKQQAEPETLKETNFARFIATVRWFKGRLHLIADIPQMHRQLLPAKNCSTTGTDQLKDGDWVIAHLTKHPLRDEQTKDFSTEISAKITDAADTFSPWWVTLAEHDLPTAAPEGREDWQIKDEELMSRKDLTHLPLVTIDNRTTKDMDDALYAECQPNGDILLTIAIADPTAYIMEDDPLDEVAKQRAFTNYLPGRDVPMLPRNLADNLCSLQENQRRPALCCQVAVHQDGAIAAKADFFAAYISSKAQLNYTDVSDWLEDAATSEWQADANIASVLQVLHEFCLRRSDWREKNALIFPEKPDYRFELNEDNQVTAVVAEYRRIANRIVEEAMITANICGGRYLRSEFATGIFNTHAGYKQEMIPEVLTLMRQYGEEPEDIGAEALEQLAGYCQFNQWLRRQSHPYLERRFRKMQHFGQMDCEAHPHYAMGLDVYATWTSPIRKYTDMVNHRLLKAAIMGQKPAKYPDAELLSGLMEQRKRYRFTERHIGNWLYAQLLAHEPETQTQFTGEIFDISKSGMRLSLQENGATAFVPLSQICDDKEKIKGDNESGEIRLGEEIVYRLGDHVTVQLIEVKQQSRSLVAKPVKEHA